jgi:hypothetical protein
MSIGQFNNVGFQNPGEVIAQIVIIEGGTNSGLFEYVGTPGPGNPPIAYATPPGTMTDPYGNALPETTGGFVSGSTTSGAFSSISDGTIQVGIPSIMTEPAFLSTSGSAGFDASLSITSPTGTEIDAVPSTIDISDSGTSAAGLVVQDSHDGNLYDTERLTLFTTTAQSFDQTHGVAINGLSVPVAIGTYRIHAELAITTTAAGGNAEINFAAPATSLCLLAGEWGVTGSSGSNLPQVVTALNSVFTSFGLNNGNQQLVIDGIAKFTAAGTLAIQGVCTNAADTWSTEAGCILEIEPVSGSAGGGGTNPSPGSVFDFFNVWNTVWAGGADPSGTLDSTAAFQAAASACPVGGTVWVPPVYWTGTAWAQAFYKISAPVVVPPGVAVEAISGSSTLAYFGGSIPMPIAGAVIQVPAAFTGATYDGQAVMGVFVFLSENLGTYTTGSGNQALKGITINGENCTTAGVNGVEAWGPVWGVDIKNVGIYAMPQYGITTSTSSADGTGKSPDLWRVEDLHIAECGSDGWMSVGGIADTYFGFSESTGNTGNGWNISGANQRWDSCKAEENGEDGWHIEAPGGTGANGSFGTWMDNCSTDHNKFNGVWIGGVNGAGPFSIGDCTFHADGANELTSAGIRISADNVLVLVSNTRVESFGSSPTFPYYGIRNDGTNSTVKVSSGLIGGSTAAVFDSSTGTIETGDQVILYTGQWDGGTVTPVANPQPGTLLAELAAAPATPTGAGQLYVDATGHLHYLGPGGTDTILAGP